MSDNRPTNQASDQANVAPSTYETIITLLQAVDNRLDRLERNLAVARPKETYTIEEAAERLNRAPWTVRDWCSKGRVSGASKVRGKGRTGEWRIPHDVLVRVQNEGPGPVQK